MEKLLKTIISEVKDIREENKKLRGELASTKAELIKAMLSQSSKLIALEAKVKKMNSVS